MTPTREKELLELIEDLAKECLWHDGDQFGEDKQFEGDNFDPKVLISLAKRVNTALAHKPLIEDRKISLTIVPQTGLVALEIHKDYLQHIADQIDQEHERGLDAHEDELNQHRGVQ